MRQYIVGIDLGTTHTVVAYAPLAATAGAQPPEIRLFDMAQLVAPGEVAALPLLPSVRYHAAPGELADAALQLPWPAEAGQPPVVLGQLARQLGAQVPGRLVASAKSWLSHAAVDRQAPILPWGAPDEVPKVSPVEASASYLRHVHAAWNARFPQHPIVVITLTGDWLPGYVPTAATYGYGIYQESIALVAPGCAEVLQEEIARRVQSMLSIS